MLDDHHPGSDEIQQALNTPTRLNALGVLTRREIEVRILGPLLDALGDEFGQERVLKIARDVIIQIARQQGKEIGASKGGRSLAHFAASLADWKKDDALSMDVLEQSESCFSFNVTRCSYAELYKILDVPQLGAILSCNRDFSLIEGFNPDIQLTRTQTIMQGADYCDFRYHLVKG
jgi:hypothetical protein